MRDERGVEGIPLRLLVTAAVLALTLPSAAAALDAYDRQRTEDRIRGEGQRVLSLAGSLALAGGGRARLTLDLRGGALTTVTDLALANRGGEGVLLYRVEGAERTAALPGAPMLRFGGEDVLPLSAQTLVLTLEYDRGTKAVAVTR